jgi:hypothetical protein
MGQKAMGRSLGRFWGHLWDDGWLYYKQKDLMVDQQ